jgi:hypothetical protein
METKLKYSEIVNKVEIVTKWLLFQLAEKVKSHKEIYLRNTLAKSLSSLKSINLLYQIDEVNNGWTLFRAQIDRLVYLYSFADEENFKKFDDWSYLKIFEYRSNIKSYNLSEIKKPKLVINHNIEEIKRYKRIKELKISWTKPDPKKILKEKGLDFIYKFGYDYASGHIHPLVSDGELEFYYYTGLEPYPYKGFDFEILIKNSIILNTIIQQEVFNQLPFKYLGILSTFIDETRKKTNCQNNDFDLICMKLLSLIANKTVFFEK